MAETRAYEMSFISKEMKHLHIPGMADTDEEKRENYEEHLNETQGQTEEKSELFNARRK